MTDPTHALAACLRLMARATPHPDDRDLWHDTMGRALRLLAQLDRDPVPDFDTPPPALHLSGTQVLVLTGAALLLFAIFGM